MKKNIINYLNDSISNEDLERLKLWLQKPKNQDKFKDFVRLNHELNAVNGNVDAQKAFENISKQIKDNKNASTRFFPKVLKYAATILILLTSTYFLFFNSDISNNDTPIISVNNIQTGTDKATLTLEDGSQVVLNKGTSYQTSYVESNGEALVYENSKLQSTEPVYNLLTVPRGGQFFVQLADGTKVWLNSESQLKYPRNFIDDKPRAVELVYGEAYFDVSPSTAHNGATFKVVSKNQDIEVLGTEFNVKAYQDEMETYTTLVEGKIALENNMQNKILKPNEQAVVTHGKEQITVKIVEVYNEISWKDGVFSFKGKPLKELMKVLSRWYDMDVVFENKALETMTFKGVLGKDQSIEDILSAIKNASIINAYEIKNKTIIIK